MFKPGRPPVSRPQARRAKQEISRKAVADYRLLFQRNLAGLCRSTASGKILECNEAFARILGYESPEEAMAQPATMFYMEPEAREGMLARLRISGSLKNFEERLRRKDGTEVWVLETVSLVEGDREHPEVLEGTLIDISAQKQIEEALRRSEQLHRNIFDFAPIGIYQSRRDGSLITANPKLAEILGYDSPEELLRVNFGEVYANAAERERLLARYGEAVKALRIELEWKRKDGTRIWVDVNVHSIRDERGESIFEGFVQDRTEQHRGEDERHALEQQLAQSQKIEAVGQLAGGIAHDFNNLLTAITGYTELLLSSLAADDPRRSHAEQVRRSAQRATSLTQQLLAFSRRQVLEPKTLNLNDVVSGIEEMLRRLIGEHIELKTRRAPDLWPVRADPGQLEQAIMNLVVNARDAMPGGGRLSIETANAELDPAYAGAHMPVEPGGYAMVAVTDSGTGMTPEVRARLFEPFFTTKEQGKGTGLGLSTTYGIVKQSGGYIWCYSEPGTGTTFKIYLPRADEAAAPAPQAAPASAAVAVTAQETILLVEDEPEVRSLVQRLLKMQGYTVVAAANADEALAIIRDFKGHIDLMVTDVVMPGMSGRQLAERLAKILPDLKVLFVSGYTDDAIVHHGILDPGTAFLQKPFTPQTLARKVREVIEAPPDQFKVS
jgi:two-component system, cell cycle sensor histidine kinase and response regulator CckA